MPYTVNVTDGGGNQASGNLGVAQCQNVVCTPLINPFVVVVSPSSPAAAVGQPVTFSATTLSVPASPIAPAGTLRFYDGATLLATQATATGSGSITVAIRNAGTHSITATFTKNRTTTAVSSLAFPELVNPPVTQIPTPCTGVCVSVGDRSIYESDSGSRTMNFMVTLSRPATSTVTVQYAVTGDSANGRHQSCTGRRLHTEDRDTHVQAEHADRSQPDFEDDRGKCLRRYSDRAR